MPRAPRVRARWVALGLALVALAATVVVAWPHVQRYTGAGPPEQFYRELDPALSNAYPPVLGIAHNAGNNLGTIRTALEYGADVIEIDVISVRGQLVAGRDQPLPWLAEHLFRGPTLEESWDASAAADYVKLDLKRTDRAFLDDVVAFVAPREEARKVMISTRDPESLRYLHDQLPATTLLLSAGFADELQRARTDESLQQVIGGLTVFQGNVDAQLVAWAHQRHLLVLAWTVNDFPRVNELVRDGVDGVTTANLAVLRALS